MTPDPEIQIGRMPGPGLLKKEPSERLPMRPGGLQNAPWPGIFMRTEGTDVYQCLPMFVKAAKAQTLSHLEVLHILA